MANHIVVLIDEEEHKVEQPLIVKKKPLKQIKKHVATIENWQKRKIEKLNRLKKEKVDKENEISKHFKCKSNRNLLKQYKNPFDSYNERVSKYKEVKNPVIKPPLGKPKINSSSRQILENNPEFEKNTWERMDKYYHKMRVNRSL